MKYNRPPGWTRWLWCCLGIHIPFWSYEDCLWCGKVRAKPKELHAYRCCGRTIYHRPPCNRARHYGDGPKFVGVGLLGFVAVVLGVLGWASLCQDTSRRLVEVCGRLGRDCGKLLDTCAAQADRFGASNSACEAENTRLRAEIDSANALESKPEHNHAFSIQSGDE